jgi:hypothetical protein
MTGNYAAQSLTGTNVSGSGGFRSGGGYGGGGSGVSAPVSSYNAFASWYANPLAAGMPSGTSAAPRTVAFGTPLYANLTSTNTSTLGAGRIGAGGLGSMGGGYGGMGTVGTSTATNRGAAYSVVINLPSRPAAPSRLQGSVERVLARSTALSQNRNIQVVLVGGTVVLRGRADSEHDRHLAENLVRLTPGVRDVVNEIQVPEAVASGASSPQ